MANGTERAEILRSRDFIGWAVTSSNGANVGTVSDILIDRKGQVRYLAVDPGFFKKAYLLPVEAMEWGDGSLQCTWSDAEVKRLPPYDASVALTAPVLAEMSRAFPRHYGDHLGSPFDPGSGPTVVPLKDAKDFRLPKGQPSLRGWTVYGSDNEKVGVVTQMLVDPVAMKVKYLDVDVDDDLFGLVDDRHVLVPLENAELRERSSDVWVQGLSGRDIASLPAYLGGPVDPLLEEASLRAFAGGGGGYDQNRMIDSGDDHTAALPPPRDAEFANRPPSMRHDEYGHDEAPPGSRPGRGPPRGAPRRVRRRRPADLRARRIPRPRPPAAPG